MAQFITLPGTVESEGKHRHLADDLIFDPFPELFDLGFQRTTTFVSVKDENGVEAQRQLLDSNGFVVVPKGWPSDGYSIPNGLQWLVGKRHGSGCEAAYMHDWVMGALRLSDIDQGLAGDRMFLWGMRARGVSWFRRRLYYRAVRWFGDAYRCYLDWKQGR